MAMRTCVYCKREVTYERTNRNLLADGGAVGFWQDVTSNQATCPAAPLDARGQQLHNVGDVHTAPTDVDDLEQFLDGTYVPPPPSVPCGEMYGMSETGDWLLCGLEKDHEGECAPATAEVAASLQQAAEAANSAGPDVDESHTFVVDAMQEDGITIVTGTIDGFTAHVSYDKSKLTADQVAQLMVAFNDSVRKVVASDMLGIDPDTLDAMTDAAEAAAAPEVKPPRPVMETPEEIEAFLESDDDDE